MPGAQKTKAAKMGFSLIEVLITMGLLTVLSLAMSSYLGFTQAAMVGVQATTDFESMVMLLQSSLKRSENCEKMIVNPDHGGQIFMPEYQWEPTSSSSAALKVFKWDGSGEVFLAPGVHVQEAFRIQEIRYQGVSRADLADKRKEYQGFLLIRSRKGRNPAVMVPGTQELSKKVPLQVITDADGTVISCRSTGGSDDPDTMCQSMGGVWSTVTNPPSCVFRSLSTPTMLVCPGSPGCGATSSTALTGTWTVPDRVTSITVTAVGGGGGGGGATDGEGNWNECRSGAGGAGGEIYKMVIPTTPGTVYRWTAGAGGAGASRAGGENGNCISFRHGQAGAPTTLRVEGSATAILTVLGGGGAVSGEKNSINGVGGAGAFPGQSGSAGGFFLPNGQGGGGGGGWTLPLPDSTTGQVQVFRGGAGGAARWWGGSHGDVGANGGRGAGGGGGGCGDNGGGACGDSTARGGRGGDGAVVIVYQQDSA